MLRHMSMQRLGSVLLLACGLLAACADGDENGPRSKPLPTSGHSISITVRHGFIREGTQDLNGHWYGLAPLRVPDGEYRAEVQPLPGGDVRLTVAEPAAVTTLHAVYRK